MDKSKLSLPLLLIYNEKITDNQLENLNLKEELTQVKSFLNHAKLNNLALSKRIIFLEKEIGSKEELNYKLTQIFKLEIKKFQEERETMTSKLDTLERKIDRLNLLVDSLKNQLILKDVRGLELQSFFNDLSLKLAFIKNDKKTTIAGYSPKNIVRYKKIKKKKLLIESIYYPSTNRINRGIGRIDFYSTNLPFSKSFTFIYVPKTKINNPIDKFSKILDNEYQYFYGKQTIDKSEVKKYFKRGRFFYEVYFENEVLTFGEFEVY